MLTIEHLQAMAGGGGFHRNWVTQAAPEAWPLMEDPKDPDALIGSFIWIICGRVFASSYRVYKKQTDQEQGVIAHQALEDLLKFIDGQLPARIPTTSVAYGPAIGDEGGALPLPKE